MFIVFLDCAGYHYAAFCWETDLYNARRFCSKNAKFGREICFLYKNQSGRNEICCAEGNPNYKSKMCEKEFSDSKFDKEVIGKISIFQDIAPNFTFLKITWFINFMAIAWEEYSFFFKFCQLWIVKGFYLDALIGHSALLHWIQTKLS